MPSGLTRGWLPVLRPGHAQTKKLREPHARRCCGRDHRAPGHQAFCRGRGRRVPATVPRRRAAGDPLHRRAVGLRQDHVPALHRRPDRSELPARSWSTASRSTGRPDGVAMVFQHFGLLPWKTVYDNAAFGLAMAGAPAAHIKERVAHYLALVGLTGFEKHYPYQLSGGMQQRVGLVRALAINPVDPADGRAVRRARCADPRDPAGRIAGADAAAGRTQDHGVHHPLDRRGDPARRPHRGDERAAGPHQGDDRHAVRPPARRRAVRADPRFAELRAHIWHELHPAQPRRRAKATSHDASD